MVKSCLAASLLILAAGPPAFARAAPPDGVLHYSGIASDLGSGRILYGEQHYVRYEASRAAERVVLYTCLNGAPFARKVVRYSVAPATAFAPDFELVDMRRGQHEGLRSAGSRREVFYREKAGAREVSAAAPSESGWVADAGFDEFVRAHWQPLLRDGAQHLEFLIPSRLDLHGFQVKHQRAITVDGAAAQVFRLRLSGWLGLLLPHIDAYYSEAGHVLLRYEGLSNLQDAKGNHYKVRVNFPQDKRAAADQAALAAAKSAPLASCG